MIQNLPVHNNTLTGLVQGSHQFLIDDHLGHQSVDTVLLQLKHLSQDGLVIKKLD